MEILNDGEGRQMDEGIGKKREVNGRMSGWWGYDELKMTLSGSPVSKDHSVC